MFYVLCSMFSSSHILVHTPAQTTNKRLDIAATAEQVDQRRADDHPIGELGHPPGVLGPRDAETDGQRRRSARTHAIQKPR